MTGNTPQFQSVMQRRLMERWVIVLLILCAPGDAGARKHREKVPWVNPDPSYKVMVRRNVQIGYDTQTGQSLTVCNDSGTVNLYGWGGVYQGTTSCITYPPPTFHHTETLTYLYLEGDADWLLLSCKNVPSWVKPGAAIQGSVSSGGFWVSRGPHWYQSARVGNVLEVVSRPVEQQPAQHPAQPPKEQPAKEETQATEVSPTQEQVNHKALVWSVAKAGYGAGVEFHICGSYDAAGEFHDKPEDGQCDFPKTMTLLYMEGGVSILVDGDFPPPSSQPRAGMTIEGYIYDGAFWVADEPHPAKRMGTISNVKTIPESDRDAVAKALGKKP